VRFPNVKKSKSPIEKIYIDNFLLGLHIGDIKESNFLVDDTAGEIPSYSPENIKAIL